MLDEGAEPLGRVVHGFGNDGRSGFEGCRLGRAIGTYLHGPLLPRNPWLADWLLAQALAHATGGGAPELTPLADELEREAFRVAAARRGSEAVAANCGILVGHPIPPPAAIVTRKSLRVVIGTCRDRDDLSPAQGAHISPR